MELLLLPAAAESHSEDSFTVLEHAGHFVYKQFPDSSAGSSGSQRAHHGLHIAVLHVWGFWWEMNNTGREASNIKVSADSGFLVKIAFIWNDTY